MKDEGPLLSLPPAWEQAAGGKPAVGGAAQLVKAKYKSVPAITLLKALQRSPYRCPQLEGSGESNTV